MRFSQSERYGKMKQVHIKTHVENLIVAKQNKFVYTQLIDCFDEKAEPNIFHPTFFHPQSEFPSKKS